MIMEANPSHGERELALSMHDFFAYRDAQRSFETFGASHRAFRSTSAATNAPSACRRRASPPQR